MTTPTEQVYGNLQTAFDELNAKVFENELPHVVLTLQRKKNVYGFYCKGRFGEGEEEGKTLDEIALNPEFGVDYRDPQQLLSTLAHEMVHLWQHVFGNPTKSNHHNKEWGDKMRSIGLPPKPTRPGGKITGNSVTHSIDPNGLFASVAGGVLQQCDNLGGVGDIMRTQDLQPKRKSGKYQKYECPCCDTVARAKKEQTFFCGCNGEANKMAEEGTTEYLSIQALKLVVKATN